MHQSIWKTKTTTYSSIENQIGLPTGNYLVVPLQEFQRSWMHRKLNREGCMVWAVAGSIYVKDMPRARRNLAQALENMPEPVVLELVPSWLE